MITDYNIFTEDFQADDISVIDVSKETATTAIMHTANNLQFHSPSGS